MIPPRSQNNKRRFDFLQELEVGEFKEIKTEYSTKEARLWGARMAAYEKMAKKVGIDKKFCQRKWPNLDYGKKGEPEFIFRIYRVD